MILVDDAGTTYDNVMNHSPWGLGNGAPCPTLADTVFPTFLFVVGLSIPLSMKKFVSTGAKWVPSRKALIRFVKLFVLGLISQSTSDLGFPFYDLFRLRIPGILQRIACGYLVAALTEIFMPVRDHVGSHEHESGYFRFHLRYLYHWGMYILFTGVYLALMFGIDPGCGYGSLTEGCNVPRYIDEKVLGSNHMYQVPTYVRSEACSFCAPSYCPRPRGPHTPDWCFHAFDPEGITTTFSAVTSSLIGLFFGHILISTKSHEERLKQWIPLSILMMGAGLGIHFGGFPFNKNLWSTSYVLVMAGGGGLLFSILYVLIDVYHFKLPFAPFRWMGLNAIFVFLMGAADLFDSFLEFFYYRNREDTIIHLLRDKWLAKWLGYNAGILTFVLIKISFWAIIAGILNKKKIWFKV
jgi:heparan-alpha-glucosaminide N-acetyltransferase